MEETTKMGSINWEKELEQNLVFQSIIMNRTKEEKRKNLANCRSGEYEGLSKKLIDPQWKPDFGPAEFNKSVEKSGVTSIYRLLPRFLSCLQCKFKYHFNSKS